MVLDLEDEELQALLDMAKYALLVLNVVLFLTAALVFFSASPGAPASTGDAASDAKRATKHALVVTAHPDDESMFFLPLLHSLQHQDSASDDTWETHLLCLSRGNADGLGATRETELRACAEFLGFKPSNVHVLEDPKLQDGMQTQWDTAHIASIVLAYLDKHSIHAVFTFDSYGVSGHANHIATHFGVQMALQQQRTRCEAKDGSGSGSGSDSESKQTRGWALESTSLARKYVGLLDTALSFWQSHHSHEERAFVFACRPLWNYQAMALHRSQFVWYRRLFVAFSRYTFINTFRPLVSSGDSSTLSAQQKKEQ